MAYTNHRSQPVIIWGLRAVTVVLFFWVPVLTVWMTVLGTPAGTVLAWQSLDLAELAGLVVTLWAVKNRHASLSLVSLATAGLFVLDAFVDSATSSMRPSELTTALVMALCAELPVALACLYVGGHFKHLGVHEVRSNE